MFPFLELKTIPINQQDRQQVLTAQERETVTVKRLNGHHHVSSPASAASEASAANGRIPTIVHRPSTNAAPTRGQSGAPRGDTGRAARHSAPDDHWLTKPRAGPTLRAREDSAPRTPAGASDACTAKYGASGTRSAQPPSVGSTQYARRLLWQLGNHTIDHEDGIGSRGGRRRSVDVPALADHHARQNEQRVPVSNRRQTPPRQSPRIRTARQLSHAPKVRRVGQPTDARSDTAPAGAWATVATAPTVVAGA